MRAGDCVVAVGSAAGNVSLRCRWRGKGGEGRSREGERGREGRVSRARAQGQLFGRREGRMGGHWRIHAEQRVSKSTSERVGKTLNVPRLFRLIPSEAKGPSAFSLFF